MRLQLALGLMVWILTGTALGVDQAAVLAQKPLPKPADPEAFGQRIRPFFAAYCAQCHSGPKAKAEIALDKYADLAGIQRDRGVFERVIEVLRAREMPPPRRPKQPKDHERAFTIEWLEKSLGSEDCIGKKDPGRVTLRRLNRTEYNNTIRDLVGVEFRPADDFPADDVGYGFDNIGDVLSLSPLLFEKYVAAAEKIVQAALANPKLRQRIFICQPGRDDKEKSARRILENFARRAYRRPLHPEELSKLVNFIKLAESHGEGFDQGVALALQAVLTSPHFLFKIERDPRGGRTTVKRPISEFELATRLSYFLWSSMPDDELMALAQQNSLRKEGVLETQVRRMLASPKAAALAENFAGQWLQTRNLKTAAPDPGLFPAFDEPLRAAMLRETELFFESIRSEDRSILDFLDADYTFVNQRLARHYGIKGVEGEAFQRVRLTDSRRGGILTQAAVLTLTSNPTRTSPVKRGKWILENILGTPPSPPPPDAGELKEDQNSVLSGSLRQRMEQHRANPNCAVCHQRMDALGFGFENFDAIGAWRDKDGAFAIDASGTLPGGRTFRGPAELRKLLGEQEKGFARCLTEKMLTYALGRGLESNDRCTVDDIVTRLAGNNYRFSVLVIEIVKSDAFQMRRGRKAYE